MKVMKNMKKTNRLLFLVVGFVFLLVFTAGVVLLTDTPIAHAVAQLGAGTNNLYFTNAENWVDMNNDGEIGAGDLFYGIVNVQNIDLQGVGTVWSFDNVGPDIDTLSGYFLTEVIGVSVHDSQTHIQLGPATTDPNGVLSLDEITAGVVMKLFADDTSAGGPGTPYTEYSGSVAGDIAAATDGDFWMSFVLGDTGYWYTHAPVVPPGNPGESIGDSWFGLNVYENNSGYILFPTDDPLEIESSTSGPGVSLVQMYGTSNINVNDDIDAGSYWDFTSEDPATVVTPEPSTLLLLGGGLLGLGALARRRMKQ